MTLDLQGLSRNYGPVQAVAEVDLSLQSGETLALLGPSGCGKSTLLRLVAGLEAPDRGKVVLDGVDQTGVPAERRNVGMVFQDYALFPHLSVADNVAFGLVERRRPVRERRERVAELLQTMGLEGTAERRPHQLSGGQQQRVALARALAPRPTLLLLDEPLSNLDRTLRDDLTDELAALLRNLQIRALHVTHDQAEAFRLGNRVALMREGRIVQVDTPDAMVARPASAFVARFLGLRELLQATAARTLGFDGPVLLRTERLTPDPNGRVFTVRRVARLVASLDLTLFAPDWNVELRWHVHDRELAATPAPGDELRLRVPDDAWQPLTGVAA